MRITAQAQPNIALIKYWGKSDVDRNLPSTGSLSITLDSLYTRMTVELTDAGQDSLQVNGVADDAMLPRLSTCIDRMLGSHRPAAEIVSDCNFPIAAGLASSASAFAALVVAVDGAGGLQLDQQKLARYAGQASGSAARSLFGGFAELSAGDDQIEVAEIKSKDAWPLEVIVAVTEESAKPMSSSAGMQLSAATSPFYAGWVDQQPADLDVARAAVETQDFAALGQIAEHNCLKMHSVMWASRPPLVYWNSATLACMETVRRLQQDGVPVFFTIDAGPQVKAVCEPSASDQVEAALTNTNGVIRILRSGLGSGAKILDDSC